jgi:hypothetical protein
LLKGFWLIFLNEILASNLGTLAGFFYSPIRGFLKKKSCLAPAKKSRAPTITKFIMSHLELDSGQMCGLKGPAQTTKNKNLVPSLLDANNVQRSTVFVTNQLRSKCSVTEIQGSYGSDGMYKSVLRKSGPIDGREFCGECVQEMMDPGRTRGCYFTVEKYKNHDNMLRGFATLNQIG